MTSKERRFTLCAADADALDLLVESGFDAARVPPFARDRAGAIVHALDGLDRGAACGAARRAALVGATLACIREATAPETQSGGDPETVRASEAAAVDELVASAWRTDALGAGAGLGALEAASLDADARSELVGKTLARVQGEIDRCERRRRLGPVFDMIEAEEIQSRPRLRGRVRLADLLAAASIALIATAVLSPVVGAVRRQGVVRQTQANMRNAAVGFDLYGAERHGALPVATAGSAWLTGAGRWWDVGTPRSSNSANLFTLAKGGYATVKDLSSPGNPYAPVRMDAQRRDDWRVPEEVSFSYLLAPRGETLSWSHSGRIVVMADKSPVVDRARRGEAADPLLGSPNYRGRGLSVLFSDGSVLFYLRPVLENGDNIWLPGRGAGAAPVKLRGDERPEDKRDAFVGP